MHIFRRIFLSNYRWQKSDIWSQASYRYPISWEAFFDPSDSYFLFAKERGYHKLSISSLFILLVQLLIINQYQKFKDAKGVIRSRKSKKYRQHNGQKNYDKRTNNDLQNTTQKTKD